jgi:hypothetical protein
MPLTIDQLRGGIRYWRDERPSWDRDFHNAFYRDTLPTVRPNSGTFDEEWWNRMWKLLQDWSATRRGGGRKLMTQRALDRLGRLGETWVTEVVPRLGGDIESVEWREIAAFPAVVAEIKQVKSPVFTSKFCHLLAPRVFPVVDNEAMGNPYSTYEEYFFAAKLEWRDTPAITRDDLVAQLTSEIGTTPFSGFPMKCKLIELCLIGRRQARRKTKNSRLGSNFSASSGPPAVRISGCR